MPIPLHLKPVYDAVMSAPRSLPLPWKQVSIAPVGGLTDVGFIGNSDFLLVLSGQGRGIYDCLTGERVERDRDEDYPFDPSLLQAPGFGRFEGEIVRTSGLYGGGLALTTADGWGVEEFVFAWPDRIVTLCPPGHSAFSAKSSRPSDLSMVASHSELRAFGFSPSGLSFVVGTSSDLTMVSRSIQDRMA